MGPQARTDGPRLPLRRRRERERGRGRRICHEDPASGASRRPPPLEAACLHVVPSTVRVGTLRDVASSSLQLLRVIRVTTPSEQSALVIHAHHALGDGLGMLFAMSPMLGVEGGNPLSTVPLPNIVLPPFARKPAAQQSERNPARSSRCNACGCVVNAFKSIGKFCKGFFVMPLSGHDTEISINEPLEKRTPFLPFSGKRQLTRFPVVPLTLIKKARDNHNCTLNDVVMASVTGALRKYCLEDPTRMLQLHSCCSVLASPSPAENAATSMLCYEPWSS